jgi:heptosyltransferase I
MRVLIVKMSSMGDIIHTLPAVSDACYALPGIKFDWITEEAFTEIPAWHENVNSVIPIALRRWRKHPFFSLKQGEPQQFLKQLRLEHYDKVIDAQGSLKSAVITRLSRGYRVGLDKNSVREVFADLAYQQKFAVSWKQHAIDRLRCLFAQALGYPLIASPPSYGINRMNFSQQKIKLPATYLIAIPNASWVNKRWPDASWSKLLAKVAQKNIPVFITWGNEAERKRAIHICANRLNINVLPKLNLQEMTSVLAKAKAAVCVDTGLSHLAAALETPAITLYGPTDPQRIGTRGPLQIQLKSPMAHSGCTLSISVDAVWQALQTLLIA